MQTRGAAGHRRQLRPDLHDATRRRTLRHRSSGADVHGEAQHRLDHGHGLRQGRRFRPIRRTRPNQRGWYPGQELDRVARSSMSKGSPDTSRCRATTARSRSASKVVTQIETPLTQRRSTQAARTTLRQADWDWWCTDPPPLSQAAETDDGADRDSRRAACPSCCSDSAHWSSTSVTRRWCDRKVRTRSTRRRSPACRRWQDPRRHSSRRRRRGQELRRREHGDHGLDRVQTTLRRLVHC